MFKIALNFINDISEDLNKRVLKYGASYKSLAIFTLLDYPLSYLFHQSSLGAGQEDSLFLRSISLFLNLILLFHEKWPTKIKQYLAVYWYFNIGFGITFLGTYLLIINSFSLNWLMNSILGIMLLVLLVDWFMALILMLLGVISGYLIVFLTKDYGLLEWPTINNLSLFIYMFAHIILLIAIFARNKEIFNNYKEKLKDDLNMVLEFEVEKRTEDLSKVLAEKKALESKNEFLNNISHELRTPIQGVDGIAEGLVEHWDDLGDKERYKYAKQIAKNSSRLLSLVGNLLDLSKFNSGKIILDLRPLNISRIVEDMIEESQELYAKNKKIQFVLEINLKKLDKEIIADAECITQVLRNLVVNAIKFSTKDEVNKISIKIADSEIAYNNRKKVEAIQISISDEGVGIPAGELEEIFLPFSQSSRTKTKAGGTGLGLAICKQLVEAHKGKIWAENNKGNNDKGAVFHFLLPLSQGKETAAAKVADEVRNDEAAKKILIIDDEEACLVSMELLLRNTGYQLIKASSGYEGLNYLKATKERVDLIFLDLMLPDIYGLNFLKEIKANPLLANIPVILQTGTSDLAEVEKAYDIGIAGYIKKPYKKETIITELNKTFAVIVN